MVPMFARFDRCAWMLLALATCAAAAAPFDDTVKAGEHMPRLYSLLVSQHGELVLERYFHGARASSYANVKSASKSVISALIGIAIDRKLLPGVDAPIAPYFPELAASSADPRKRRITIEDLLTMRSGLVETNRGYGAWVRSPDWVHYLLAHSLQSVPGEQMNYNTGNTHLLSAILTKVSGGDTWSFAGKVLAGPLGITLPKWPQDPQGVYFGGNDMLLTPRQMLKFGELYLHRGRAGDRQIVPASWVEASFVPRARSPISGQLYGYGWWITELAGRETEFAWGFGGQYIFIVPSLDLVVVTTSSVALGDDRREHRRALFELVEKQVIGALAPAGGSHVGVAASR
jgi:CubicO group peptidase (beta-lactamase class C family)